MIVSCSNCDLVLDKYLCDMPPLWRKAIVSTICKALFEVDIDCEDINKCETVTKLSAFTQQGDNVCITYTDELGGNKQKCFQFPGMIDLALMNVDPYCIASPEDWILMTYAEKVQEIIDHRCECC